MYKEWTPRRSWKERKRAAKTRENDASQFFSQIQDPELIFYGHHSGVVGLSKCEVYQSLNDHELLQLGYDKVIFNQLSLGFFRYSLLLLQVLVFRITFLL